MTFKFEPNIGTIWMRESDKSTCVVLNQAMNNGKKMVVYGILERSPTPHLGEGSYGGWGVSHYNEFNPDNPEEAKFKRVEIDWDTPFLLTDESGRRSIVILKSHFKDLKKWAFHAWYDIHKANIGWCKEMEGYRFTLTQLYLKNTGQIIYDNAAKNDDDDDDSHRFRIEDIHEELNLGSSVLAHYEFARVVEALVQLHMAGRSLYKYEDLSEDYNEEKATMVKCDLVLTNRDIKLENPRFIGNGKPASIEAFQ